VEIDGQEFDNKANDIGDDSDITPNWEFSKAVDVARGTIPVKLEIWDADSFLRGDDDQSDINPNPGRALSLTVTLAPCSVSGDVACRCGTTLTSAGTEDDRSQVWFRVEVVEPPTAPGLNVRCVHDPIWPQPGDTVTITATSLDSTLGPRIANNIEIWVNETNAPAVRGGGLSLGYIAGPFALPTFAYGCRVRDDDLTVWTGWRVVNVGNPSFGRAVPILFTGPSPSRIDILFIADRDNYTGATDPTFIADVGRAISGAYYQSGTTFTANPDLFLRNQDKFNFWIALDMGDAEPVCKFDSPDMDNYPFADAAVLLHTNPFRDCALVSERVFSTEPTSFGTVLHESGHTPFGLADEYCCDGGYFQTGSFPNVYAELKDCASDASNLGRTIGDCREIKDTNRGLTTGWFTSEPASDDLMLDNGSPQAADDRRIRWLLDSCSSSDC
jgi:hypothetical protein